MATANGKPSRETSYQKMVKSLPFLFTEAGLGNFYHSKLQVIQEQQNFVKNHCTEMKRRGVPAESMMILAEIQMIALNNEALLAKSEFLLDMVRCQKEYPKAFRSEILQAHGALITGLRNRIVDRTIVYEANEFRFTDPYMVQAKPTTPGEKK